MRFLIALAASSLALSGTANAQHTPQKQQPARQQTAPKQPQQGQRTQGYAAPKAWKGTHASYQSHATRCFKKYRSYNPRTDRYTVHGNQTAICRL